MHSVFAFFLSNSFLLITIFFFCFPCFFLYLLYHISAIFSNILSIFSLAFALVCINSKISFSLIKFFTNSSSNSSLSKSHLFLIKYAGMFRLLFSLNIFIHSLIFSKLSLISRENTYKTASAFFV